MAAEQKTYKVVLLGDTGVGKSSIVQRYVYGSFKHDSQPTIGASFMSKTLEIAEEGIHVRFQIWDTAGQEKYKSLAPMYYRDAMAAVCVYDITNKDSFESVKEWVEDLQQKAPDNIVIALVGNKSDLQEKEKVPLSVATQYAKEISAPYGNTSAKEDIGVNDIFVKIARKLHRMHVAPLDDERRESVVVDGRSRKLKNGSKKGKCC